MSRVSSPRIATRPPAPATRRLRTAWKAAHTPVAGVPRWARIAAYAIPYVVLPSSIWRIAVVTFHAPLMGTAAGNGDDTLPGWFPVELYVVLLSLVSEFCAFLALGLIARWGEVFPRWIPALRGRRVPVSVAIVPATAGAAVLTALWTWVIANALFGRTLQGEAAPPANPFSQYDWNYVIAAVAYVPLVAWGPLLAAVTVVYYRRRRARRVLRLR